MNAIHWRHNWLFVILGVLAIFLFGVTVTIVSLNVGHAALEPVSARFTPGATSKPISVTPVDVQWSATASLKSTASVVRVALKPTAYIAPAKGTYRTYTVQPGQTLSRLDPEGWQHTCDINKQLGNIKMRDCKIIAGASILLPVAIVIALSQEQAPLVAPFAVVQSPRAVERDVSLDLNQRLHLAEKARQHFCDHPGNERSYACTPERAAQIELQALALMIGRRRI